MHTQGPGAGVQGGTRLTPVLYTLATHPGGLLKSRCRAQTVLSVLVFLGDPTALPVRTHSVTKPFLVYKNNLETLPCKHRYTTAVPRASLEAAQMYLKHILLM